MEEEENKRRRGHKMKQPLKNKPPIKKTNKELRTREYLTSHEVDDLRKVARKLGRLGHRDDTLILMMFYHALRVSEVVNLRWEQIDFNQSILHVKRVKRGVDSTHPLRAVEVRALRRIKKENDVSPYVFLSERKAPLTTRSVRHIISKAGDKLVLGFPVHAHMLRHATGFYLAGKGIDTRGIQCYMGHSCITNTTIYTDLSPNRFNKFWD